MLNHKRIIINIKVPTYGMSDYINYMCGRSVVWMAIVSKSVLFAVRVISTYN